MSKLYAVTARMHFQEQNGLSAKQEVGTKKLERLNDAKKQNNLRAEETAERQDQVDDTLTAAKEYEGEHGFSTGLKSFFGIETRSERLNVKKERLNIETRHNQRTQQALQAKTDIVTQSLQSNISESKDLTAETAKVESKDKSIQEGRRADGPIAQNTGARGLKRSLQVEGKSSVVQRQTIQVADAQQCRALENQETRSHRMKSEDCEGLKDKEDGTMWGNLWKTIGASTVAGGLIAGLAIVVVGALTGGILWGAAAAVAGTYGLMGGALNYFGSDIAESRGADQQAEHTAESQRMGVANECDQETISDARQRMSRASQTARNIKQVFAKADELI